MRPQVSPRAGIRDIALAAFMLLAVYGSQLAAAEDQTSARERLMKEGPPAWEAWKDYLGKFEAKAVVTEQGLGKTAALKPHATERYHLFSNAPNLKMIRFFESGPVRKLVYCVNNQYAFQVSQPGDNSPYVIKYLESEGKEVFESIDVRVLQYSGAIYEFWGKALATFFTDPNFTFKEVTSVVEDGEDLVRVSFDFKWHESQNTGPFQGGSFLLSPRNRWAVKRYELKTGLPSTGFGTHVVAVEFGDEDAGFRKPKKVTSRTAGDQSGHVVETVCLFENWEHKTIDPSQFRLPAFGLPETIAKGGQPATPAALAAGFGFGSGTWLLVLGALAAVVAVALRIWSYRAAASKARME